MTISIQGVKGAFHEEAAINYYGEEIEILPNISFYEVIESIRDNHAKAGIMAVENTISGTIHSNLNLIRESGLAICGEVYLQIEQNLVGLPGTSIDNLVEVHSHYMAIDQCRNFFRKHPHIKLIESDDTALSMKEIAEKQLTNVGAIGSRIGARHYGLNIIAESIETNKKNYTRFLIVEKENKIRTHEMNKSSISMTLPNHKGSLSQVLSVIAFYDVDLSKIESVPVVGEPWHYRFYIDVLFDNFEKYKSMLQAIGPLTDELQILGEYASGSISFAQIHSRSNPTSS
ncbi:MAG: prephenate dehydratase [Marinilabiliales bacterium]|nr:MAG: prephenate dehydratase [Marinilabiliales bacterium]